MDLPKEQQSAPKSATFMDLIREVGDKATEQVRQEMQAQATASSPKVMPENQSNESLRRMGAESVLRNGLASTIEEALKKIDEAH